MANPIIIQKQIKDNAEDVNNFIRDLKLWEDEMKRKDRHLSSDQSNEEVLPPVRKAKLSSKTPPKSEILKDNNKNIRISSSDYKRWEKFDVEKACEEIDNEDKTNLEENEDCDEQNKKYMIEIALYEKEMGNKHVKAAKWDEAIEAYTRAIAAYSKDPIFYANRAQCYLKKKKWAEVETDCTEALKLDSTYVKAYLRRAVAREALCRLEDAKNDLSQVLRLEPGNTQAYRDLQRLKESGMKKNVDNKMVKNDKPIIKNADKESKSVSNINISSPVIKTEHEELNQVASSSNLIIKEEISSEPNWGLCDSVIQPITKPPHLRSKKSLKRIEIHDVGVNAPKHVCSRNLPKQMDTSTNSTPTISSVETSIESKAGTKPRSVLSLAGMREVPTPPKTSVQFHQSWSTIKDDTHLCYQYLKQIPGEKLADIFKESLESRMFSSILGTLASECGIDDEAGAVLSYLQGLTSVKRFSTLALFLSSADKSNLTKLFEYCLSRCVCSLSDIEHFKRLYEM